MNAEANVIGENNIDGDTLDYPGSAEDLAGIWLSKPVVASGLFTNSFVNVATPIPPVSAAAASNTGCE